MRYKLLKDLPGYPAGTVFETNRSIFFGISGEWRITTDSEGLKHTRSETNFSEYPDWFTPLTDTDSKWQPTNDDHVYIVNTYDAEVSHITPGDDNDRTKNEWGQCFRTKETAEKVAEAVKAALRYVHTPYTAEAGETGDEIEDLLSQARAAVQADTGGRA